MYTKTALELLYAC